MICNNHIRFLFILILLFNKAVTSIAQAPVIKRYANNSFPTTFKPANSIAATDFDPKVEFNVGGFEASSVNIADIDGDGKPDIVVSNSVDNSIVILRNVSSPGSITSSSFANGVILTTGPWPEVVKVFDIDGDGKPDIVTANYANANEALGNTISIFRNTSVSGIISFSPKVDLVSGTLPWSVDVGDIDGDGKPDIVVANTISNTISIFRNISTTGSITAASFAPKIDIAAGSEPWDVTLGDLDGDGKLDIVFADINTNAVSILRNKAVPGIIAPGSFDARVDFAVGNSPSFVTISDLDGDGKPDIAVANQSGKSISVLRNTSTPGSIITASFQKTDFYVDFPFGVEAGDIDGDGKPDLVVANFGLNTISVLHNTTTGGGISASSFDPKFDLPASNAASLAIGDLDGDGKPDIVVATANTVTIYRNHSQPIIAPVGSPPVITYPTPNVYTVNTAIPDLVPANSGGAVPPGNYGEVTSFVGSGAVGSADGKGAAASMTAPLGLTIDAAGNMYVADYNNNTIRKITPDGTVTTFAGKALVHGTTAGFGTNALFSLPQGVAIDASGNIYVADSFNDLIRVIGPDSYVSTFAGKTGVSGSADGIGTNATFSSPNGIAVDNAGNVYVADGNNNMIRKIDPKGGVTTLAGSTTAGKNDGLGAAASFNYPAGLTVDAAGNVYVSDAGNNLIRKITPAGNVTTIAGSGAAGADDGVGILASFNRPLGITMDNQGSLYIADEKSNEIRKIATDGTVTTVAGNGTGGTKNGTAKNATFSYPGSIVVDGKGNVYVGDINGYLIRKVALTGYTIDKPLPPGLIFDPGTGHITGTPTAPWPATDYKVTAYNVAGSSSFIVNIKVNNNQPPLVAAPIITYTTPNTYPLNTAITPLKPTNTGGAVPATIYGQVTTVAGNGTKGSADGPALSASFQDPTAITIDRFGNFYIVDSQDFKIRKLDVNGQVSTYAGNGHIGFDDGAAANATFSSPAGITTDYAGNVYVADLNNNAIREITPQGIVSTFAGSGVKGFADGTGTTAIFDNPVSITTANSGDLYVTDATNERIRIITPGAVTSTLTGSGLQGSADGPPNVASFYQPYGLAVDNAGNVFLADRFNYKIREISPAGVVKTIAGTGVMGANNGSGLQSSFNTPTGVALDDAGTLYVVDNGNSLIRKITPDGTVSTLAGSGAQGSADGVSAAASFYFPAGIAYDKKGSLYITDTQFSLIRKVVITGYTIDKQLPPGLSFDPTTGYITGTPTTVSPATNYTVTAYNTGGSSSFTVSIEVKNGIVNTPIPLPPNISYVQPNPYVVNTAIAPLSPQNTGGPVPATVYGQVSTYAVGTQNGIFVDNNFNSVAGLSIDPYNDIYIVDEQSDAIKMLSPQGVVTLRAGGSVGSTDGTGAAASFFAPYGVVFAPNGNLYVADQSNNKIREITPFGVVSTFAGQENFGSADGQGVSASFKNPVNLTTDAGGNLYVSDSYNNLIRKITPGGAVSTIAGLLPGFRDGKGTSASFYQPNGVAIDASGVLYVADQANYSIRKITPNGTVTTFAGNGKAGHADGTGTAASFFNPGGLYIDKIGNVFVADASNNLLRKITPAGVVTTVAGDGTTGNVNAVGTAAKFGFLSGIVGDGAGNIYVADRDNNTIREIAVTGYFIDKPLPPGLTFDATTGTISGKPTSPSPATTYTITAYNLGGSSSAQVIITVEKTLAFSPIPPKTVCDANFDPGATTNSGNVIAYTSSNTAVATIIGGKVHITGAGTSDITASDGFSTGTQTLTVIAAVIPAVTVSPATQDNCQGLAVTYTATPTNGGNNPTYQWQVNGQSSGSNSPVFISSTLKNNDKITCVLTSDATCTTTPTATSNVASFIIDAPVTTAVSITSSAIGPICAGTPVSFTAVLLLPDAGAVYQWQINGTNAGSGGATFTTNTLAAGDAVTCIVTSSFKCLVTPTVTSNLITTTLSPPSACIIVAPNAFTPNGDGINDLWDITSLQAHVNCVVSVFTRSGTRVYNSIGYSKAWDGSYNGRPLPVGTYYYIIDLKNGKKPLSGFVTILR